MACLVENMLKLTLPQVDDGGLDNQCESLASQLCKPHCLRRFCLALAKCVCKIQETCLNRLSLGQRKCVRMNLRHGANGNFIL